MNKHKFFRFSSFFCVFLRSTTVSGDRSRIVPGDRPPRAIFFEWTAPSFFGIFERPRQLFFVWNLGEVAFRVCKAPPFQIFVHRAPSFRMDRAIFLVIFERPRQLFARNLGEVAPSFLFFSRYRAIFFLDFRGGIIKGGGR